ncbi:T9SS type A sorting domain-containing protein [Croceimicrobium sp.]|uniref:T9SS type A sorting domain-containing protein n=1 Tax=Croceimicrobium sp. TaxID=2828340 RepID=UPI003BA9C1C8
MKNHYLLLSILFFLSYTSLAQETFSIEFGQFFEQGYGSSLDEEGIDLGPFNTDKLLVGWQNVSDGESGIKDAAIWHIEERGKEQYLKLIGSTEYDEVATGVIQVDSETYAVCVHQSSNWQHLNVKGGDQTWIYLIQSGGTILWSYNITPDEEGGIAPSDIILDANEEIVVLLNRLNASGTVSNEIISLNKLGQLNWSSSRFSQSSLGGWAFELLELSGNFITLVNDRSLNLPFAIEFGYGGSINNVVNYANSFSNHLYGLDYDNISQSILGAGYTVIEGDTNSYVARISQGLSFISDWNYGISGTEKFIDIVSTGDGFVAGGVRSNKGEGKFDCYLHHLNGNLATYAEETMGGSTTERLNNLNMMVSGTDVWFAGHNIEWTLAESGNAYLGGTTLGFSVTGANCKIPRVIFVDGILDPTPGTYGAYQGGYGIGNSSDNLTTLQNIQSVGGNIIVLYDIDRVLVDLKNGSLSQNSQLVQFIEDFINQATSSPFNFTVGIVMGPGIMKLNTVSNWLSATNGVSYWNYIKPSKLNFMVLEHEFWALAGNQDFRLVDQDSWTKKPLIKAYNGGNPPANNINHGFQNNAPNQNIKNLFFDQSVRDHHYFLDELRKSTDNSANNWKIFDYISSFWNPHATSSWGTKKHYSNLDLNNPSLSISNFEMDSILYGNQFADYTKTQSDAIFLTYYRPPVYVQDYQLGNLTDPWVIRLQSLMINSPNAPANIIPLFSSEVVGCNLGYNWTTSTVRSCGVDRLGAWFGGPNTLKLAESYYYTDHTTRFFSTVSSTCPTCLTDINIVGMGWYQLNCILASENNANGVMTGNNSRLPCGSIGGYLTEEKIIDSLNQFSIYPNPSTGVLSFTGNVKGENVKVYNQQGQLLKAEKLNNSLQVDLEGLPNGIYYVSIPKLNLSWKLILID